MEKEERKFKVYKTSKNDHQGVVRELLETSEPLVLEYKFENIGNNRKWVLDLDWNYIARFWKHAEEILDLISKEEVMLFSYSNDIWTNIHIKRKMESRGVRGGRLYSNNGCYRCHESPCMCSDPGN